MKTRTAPTPAMTPSTVSETSQSGAESMARNPVTQRVTGPLMTASTQSRKKAETSTTSLKTTNMTARKMGRPSRRLVSTLSRRSVRV